MQVTNTPRPKLSQFVEISPEVHAPISIELGSLPLSIGLFAASGLSFLIGAQVPEARTLTTLGGIGLAGFGVVNLFLEKGPGRPSGPPVTIPQTVVREGVQVSPPIVEAREEAFGQVTGQIISPADFGVLDISVLSMSPTIPVTVRLANPSNQEATFDLILEQNEVPAYIPFGQKGAPITSQRSVRITLAANEVRDVENIAMAVNSPSVGVDYIDADITIKKRRISGGTSELLDNVVFVIE